MGRGQKKWKEVGWGRGKEGTLARKPLHSEKSRSLTNGASDWCGVVDLIDRLPVEVSYANILN